MPKTAPAMAGSQPIATDITAPLILDFLEWLAGYVVRRRDGRLEAVVEVTPLGHQFLNQARRGMVSSDPPRPCSAP